MSFFAPQNGVTVWSAPILDRLCKKGVVVMSKKGRVLCVTFLAAAFAVVGGFAVRGHVRAAHYQMLLENQQRHAFGELTTAVDELSAALQKGRFTTSQGLLVSILTEGYERSEAAQAAMGGLSDANGALEETTALLGKTGDYLYYLTGSVARKGSCTTEERETLNALAENILALSVMLDELQADMNAGALTPQDLAQAESRLARWREEGGAQNAGSIYQTVEADLPEMPALVYDGPFSEHLTDRKPKMLEGTEAVSTQFASAIAADALGLTQEQLTLISNGKGELPSYGFESDEASGGYYIEVTHQGGQVSTFFRSATEGEAVLTAEEGVEKAKGYLSSHGFDAMEPSYWMTYGNVVTISFAAVQDNVLLYPDLVKVEVSLVDGRVVGLECAGYLANHCVRTLEKVSVPEQAAQENLSTALNIQSHRLALIPTRGEYEVLCHEFTCETPEGGHCLVYVNAQSGQEEKVLLLLETENGTLAQ